MGTLRKTWLWASAATVLVAVGVATTVWIVQHNSQPATASAEDCAIVKVVAQDWQQMTLSNNNELRTGDGGRSDWLAIADRQSTMSDTLRAAADSVSTPTIKEELNKWADGTALAAQLQRDSANWPPGFEPPPNDEAAFIDASTTMYDAAGALKETCPGILPPLEGN